MALVLVTVSVSAHPLNQNEFGTFLLMNCQFELVQSNMYCTRFFIMSFFAGEKKTSPPLYFPLNKDGSLPLLNSVG